MSIATFAVAIVFIVILAFFLYHYIEKCEEGTSSTRVYTRSNSYSLLSNTSNPMCSEPGIQVSLERKASSVDIFQGYCHNVEMQSSRAIRNINDAALAGNPLPVCDENYLPQNYFINGSIYLTIANVSISNSSSATICVCLFNKSSKYYNFLAAGEDWKKHVSNIDCNTSRVGNNGSYAFSFDISKPTFVFLGVASTDHLHIQQLNFSATGYNISSPGDNAIKVCQLNGDHMSCSIGLQNFTSEKNQRVCLVAFEEGNPDNSYDYSNLTVILPKASEMSIKQFGIASIVTLFMFFLLLPITLVCLWKSCKQKGRETNQRLTPTGHSTKDDNTDHIFAQSKATNITSTPLTTVNDRDTVISTQVSDPTTDGVMVVHCTSAGTTHSAPPVNQVPVSAPVGNPIQETNQSDAPSQNLNDKIAYPVSEGSRLMSFNVENSSEQRFEQGISETDEN